jgi:hypothetical protein
MSNPRFSPIRTWSGSGVAEYISTLHITTSSLVDSTAPGYRTLLFFHLVDPETPILSTTSVPPQQEAWMRRALLESLDQRLPVEIVEKILREAVEARYILDEAESKVICADLTTPRRRVCGLDEPNVL